jgi:hypothetical protein
MKRIFLCSLVCFAVTACDETSKACYEEGPDRTMKQRVSACGELCEKEDAKGCEKQVELANKECIDKGNADVCDWMCNYATMGNEIYCKKRDELKPAAP